MRTCLLALALFGLPGFVLAEPLKSVRNPATMSSPSSRTT
jgi:hypothetical protein